MIETMKALSPGYLYVSLNGLEVCCDPQCQKLHSSQEAAAMMLSRDQQ